MGINVVLIKLQFTHQYKQEKQVLKLQSNYHTPHKIMVFLIRVRIYIGPERVSVQVENIISKQVVCK